LVFITTSASDVLSAVLASRHQVVGIVESAGGRGGPRPHERSALRRALSASRRRIRRLPRPLAALARERGIAHYRMYKSRDPELVQWTRALRPDAIAICGMTRLLDRSVFEIPRHGAVNLHPAALPRYRGANPFFWMYYNMETEGGVTVHFVDDGEDTGDVIFEETYPIRLGARMVETQRAAFAIGIPLLLRALDALADGSCPRRPQPRDVPFPKARRVDPHEVLGLVDWKEWPIDRAWHVVAGTQSWIESLGRPPGWRKWFRWSVGPYELGPSTGSPGSIACDERGYHVVHPQGKIRLGLDYHPRNVVYRLVG
jgi:methionyl-tRNA formyltransferase